MSGRGQGVGLVCPWESPYCTGWSTHIDISADGNQFDDSLLWHEPTWAKLPTTNIRVVDGNNLISFRSVNSWPTSGSIGALPDTPDWVTPAPGAASHPLYQAIEWKLFEDAPYAQLWLNSGLELRPGLQRLRDRADAVRRQPAGLGLVPPPAEQRLAASTSRRASVGPGFWLMCSELTSSIVRARVGQCAGSSSPPSPMPSHA